MPESVNLLGVRVDSIGRPGLEDAILATVASGRKTYFANVNIHAINIAYRQERFRRILNNAPVVYCDGEGVRVGARLLGVRLPPRIVLTYWIWDLCALCATHDLSVYLLGGTPGAPEKAAERLKLRYPTLRIAGTHHGYFHKEGPENDEVLGLVAEADPDILFVCFGMPLQEYWTEENLDRIRAKLILFGGSTIEYTAGRKRLTPAWMADHGMEWLYRLIQEPRRLWFRYLIGNPAFMLRVLRSKLCPRIEN